MKRKETVYKGLEFVPVYFEDTSLTSPDYFQITEFPTRLTAGKNLFKLRGHPSNLRVGGVLNLEVLDYNGDPIYTEVVDYIDEDKSRVIAIYVYSETSPGDCTITLLAEAQTIQGAPVPTEWQGRANVKWSRTVPVNPNVSNVSEIIFSKLPTLDISEQVGVQLDRIYSGSQQFPTYTTGTVRLFTLNGTPALELIGGKFTGDMATGTITITSPQNPSPTPNYPVVSTPFVSTIKKILSDTTALLDREYTVYSSQSIFPHTYTEFAASAFSLTYEQTPTYVATENSQSFALIQIKGLEPATGDVSRIKVYTNNKGTVGTWELVNDVELEETEIFVTSTASLFPDQSIGAFTSQSIIDTYWDAYTYTGKTTGVAPTLTWSTASLNNAMNITSATNISARNAVLVVETKPTYAGVFIATSSYKVTIDALGTRDATGLNPRLAVYISGSAVAFDSTDYFNQELPRILGKRIGEIEVTSDSQRFDDVVFNFETDSQGTASLLFVIEAGQWQIADVRTTTDNDAGYSPNYTRIRSLINTPHKANNQISFKVEYYNVDGIVSKQISYMYDKSWQGGNRYIDGDYSMLTGSLYVADSLESGVAISGYKDTGFVRSLGYEGFAAGFPGFLLWSGSALTGSAGTKGGGAYSGVGLELYANTSSYFRYSTTDSEIDVRTDKFFFGNPSSSYISGSNGVLQISSRNFLLSSSGDVIIRGDINANTGNFLDVNIRGNLASPAGAGMGSRTYFIESWSTGSIAPSTGWKSITTGSTISGSISGLNVLLPWSAPQFLWNPRTAAEDLNNRIQSASYDASNVSIDSDYEYEYSKNLTYYSRTTGASPYASGIRFMPAKIGATTADQYNNITGSNGWSGIRLEDIRLALGSVQITSTPNTLKDRVLIIPIAPYYNSPTTAVGIDIRVIIKPNVGATYKDTSPYGFSVTEYRTKPGQNTILKIPLNGIVSYQIDATNGYYRIYNARVDIEIQWKLSGDWIGTVNPNTLGTLPIGIGEIKILDVPQTDSLAVKNLTLTDGKNPSINFDAIYGMGGLREIGGYGQIIGSNEFNYETIYSKGGAPANLTRASDTHLLRIRNIYQSTTSSNGWHDMQLGSIYPGIDNNFSIGSVGRRYIYGFINTASIGYITSSNVTIQSDVIMSGSVSIGTNSLITENTLTLGPALAGGTGEGGQLGLQAKGGSYTSASFIDVYQDRLRILKGTNAGSTTELGSVNLQTGNLTLSYGSIIMPARPAFRVTGSSGYAPSSGNDIKGSSVGVDYNQGSYYNNTTGQFTCPISGLYHVWYVGRTQNSSLASVALYKNSTGTPLAFWESDTNTGHFGVSAVVNLAVNDIVTARVTAGTVTFDGNDNWGVAFIG